jgi:hypothetical protein
MTSRVSRVRTGGRVELDRDTVERDLMRLVLTVVELLRQLMERQALRRVDGGDLTEEQEERIGLTLMLLAERMAELCERYGLEPEDLNLDLGPLGPLLPKD